MKLLTDRQETLIYNNVIRAATENICKLNRTGYNFLYLCSGFIAHYNVAGFTDYYLRTGLYGSKSALAADILANKEANKWSNFRPGDEHYAYYKQKADLYARIVRTIETKLRWESE